jgi:hypothetical protein
VAASEGDTVLTGETRVEVGVSFRTWNGRAPIVVQFPPVSVRVLESPLMASRIESDQLPGISASLDRYRGMKNNSNWLPSVR